MIQHLGFKEGQVFFKCPKCCSIKPERAHHCSVCQRCIRKMDHHCPWVNNCVGENNQKYFVLFTVSTTIYLLRTIRLTIDGHLLHSSTLPWSRCMPSSWRSISLPSASNMNGSSVRRFRRQRPWFYCSSWRLRLCYLPFSHLSCWARRCRRFGTMKR